MPHPKRYDMKKPAVLLRLLCLSWLALFSFSNGLAAESKPLKWSMASWFPSQMTQLGPLGLSVTNKLRLISDGNIQLEYFEPGALIPPAECFDSVATGGIEACWSAPGYWYGKEPALVMFSAIPFGPRVDEYLAWMYGADGAELMDEIYAKYGLKSLLCGVIPPEASGWFRKEIETLEDLKGLKMRFYGLGAKVMEKLGVSTQLIPGGEIYLALELGTIDATEFSNPAIDLSLGLNQVANHYYFPGWHQPTTFLELLLNKKNWDSLTDSQRAQFEVVCGDNLREGLALGNAAQVVALKEIKAKGIQIHRWPPEFLDAFQAAWDEVVAEHVSDNGSPDFRRVWESYEKFRRDYAEWENLGYLTGR